MGGSHEGVVTKSSSGSTTRRGNCRVCDVAAKPAVQAGGKFRVHFTKRLCRLDPVCRVFLCARCVVPFHAIADDGLAAALKDVKAAVAAKASPSAQLPRRRRSKRPRTDGDGSDGSDNAVESAAEEGSEGGDSSGED